MYCRIIRLVQIPLFILIFTLECGRDHFSVSKLVHSAISCESCHIAEKIYQLSPQKLKQIISPVLSDMSKGERPLRLSEKHLLDSETCLQCHEEQHNQWKKSSHAKSLTSKSFLAAYSLEPQEWCLNCHAPLRAEKDIQISQQGVNCAVCHIRENKIYSSKESTDCVQPVYRDLAFNTSGLCANCHDFPFPLSLHPFKESNIRMQQTAFQFANSVWHADGLKCQSCHMRKSHSMNILSKTSFKFVKKNSDLISVKIKISQIGHNWPTGDLFRAIDISIFDIDQKKVGFYRIMRNFDHSKRAVIADTSLMPDQDGNIDTEVLIPISGEPYQCTIVHKYQAGSEFRLAQLLGENYIQKQLQKILYSGQCK